MIGPCPPVAVTKQMAIPNVSNSSHCDLSHLRKHSTHKQFPTNTLRTLP